ncbi:MAG: cell wall-binding repeat-containing protein, partial [Actinomycetota bacterium]|nr:cell wall-binding repeat-containing protein [Actinomycetota bacterium]
MFRKLFAAALIAGMPLLVNLAAAAEASTGYQRTVDLTFPVEGSVWYEDWYDAPRSGGTRAHQATDLMAAKLQRVHAARGGVITLMTGVEEPMPGWGYALYIRGDDGLSYGYLHLNNDSPGTDDGRGGLRWAYASGLREGSRVQRGQWLAYVGDSGAAESTDPHLHFEIEDPDMQDPALDEFCSQWERCDRQRVNPYPSLVAAQERGDLPSASRPGPTPTPTPSPAPSQAPSTPVTRLAGDDRVQTAVALSQVRESARTVVVVPAGSHVEALVGAPLAALVDGPILLADQVGLRSEVLAEIRRLGARNAYLLGGPDQVPTDVEAQLSDSGITAMARLDAADRYELSATVAREILSYPQVDGFESVLLALGEAADASRAWPDALSATALAARLRVPVLLTRGDALPAPVGDVLAELRPQAVQIVGGTAAVSDAVAQEVAR